jgi:predicted transglutaminase-like cysteine proteinase
VYKKIRATLLGFCFSPQGMVLALVFLLPVTFTDTATAAAEARPSFFNSKETPSTNLKPFKKWMKALERNTKEKAKAEGDCKASKLNKCSYSKWMAFLEKLKGKSKPVQVKQVNAFMNKARYITDNNNWGKKDYWATPSEFFARFGDCEDYSIAKFLSLKMLGFGNDEIRLVAVKDLNLKVGHAIMVVFLGGKVYVLDNQIKRVVPASSIKHYQPVFSLGTEMWWRHRI